MAQLTIAQACLTPPLSPPCRVLRPAGFLISTPAAWHASSLDIFTKLNYKYRRLARTDIYRGGYQVRTTKSVDDVIDGVAEHVWEYAAVVTAVNLVSRS